ncbi:MAG TPA: cytochrome c [Prolixibacteraceae bacterium]|nr:cytochrome c [Prolixibacteraceae bacterium]
MKTKILAFPILALVLLLNSCKKDEGVTVLSPVATATPLSQSISSGSATSIALSSSVSGTTFNWTVIQNGVSGGSAGSGSMIEQALTITGSASGIATYTIVPSANGTPGSAITVEVTVNSTIVTFQANVKPIFTVSCTPCHMPGGINPNKWDDYATAKAKITGILDRVQRSPSAAGFMPNGGTKLSDANIAILNKWVADGLLEK